MRMRIGILTQYYPPETGAPQARLSHLAGVLQRRGHDVTVLTALPNYPQGHVYSGYRLSLRSDHVDGSRVVRAPIWPTQKVGLLPRVTSYLSFVGSSTAWGLAALPRLDYLLTESPPLFLGLSGYLLSRVKRAQWIFNVSDLWPDSVVRLGIVSDGPGLRAAKRLEAFCYRRASLVTGQTRGIVEDIRDRFPGVDVRHYPNGADVGLFGPAKRSDAVRRRLGLAGKIGVIFAGLHGKAQGLEVALDAAALVENKDIVILLLGDGPEKSGLVRDARRRGLTNVRFLDLVERAEVAEIVASADIGLVTLRPGFPDAVPSKLFETLASELPVALAHDGEAAKMVIDADAGVVVPPLDGVALALALDNLSRHPEERARLGLNGRLLVEARHSRDRVADAFVDELEERSTGRGLSG
jgi:colanic acid biosynthesis glycosyl transferase WcaI